MKRLISILLLLLFFVGCMESEPAPGLSASSTSMSSTSVFVPQPQSATSASVADEPEQSLILSPGVDITFLYDAVAEISSGAAADTKRPGWIEVTDESVYYVFSQGNTYGIKQRCLGTGSETVLFQTDEHEIYSFIRIDDTRLLFESRKSVSSHPNNLKFPRSFLYIYDTQKQQFQSLTELYGLEKYSKGGTAFLENDEEYAWEGPSVTFYAYSNGYIYMDTYDDSLWLQGAHFVLRITPDGTVERLPVEMHPSSGWISVDGSFVYITVWDEKTVYAIHESNTTAEPLLSWRGDMFVESVNSAYLCLHFPENSADSSIFSRDDVRLDYDIYHRIDLSGKCLAGQTTRINHGYTDGTLPYGGYPENSRVYETVTVVTKDIYLKSAYIFEPYPEDGSGESECVGVEVYQYTWDVQLLGRFSGFDHPWHSFGFFVHGGTLYYLDSFSGDIVLRTMHDLA